MTARNALTRLFRLPPQARCGVLAGLAACLVSAGPAHAAQPEFRVTANANLRFGTFVVFASGWRTVTPTGQVTSSGSIFPVQSAPVGPAQFSIAYDRGNNGNKSLDLVIEVTVLPQTVVTQGGVTGTLSGFTSDIPGALNLIPGQVITLVITGCRTRICGRTFNVGARIDVTRSFGGAALSAAIPVTATLVSVN